MVTDPQEAEWIRWKAACDTTGKCPYSGLQVTSCQRTDLCDCFDYPQDQRGA